MPATRHARVCVSRFLSFWPKSSPKGARRKKLTAPPDDPSTDAPPPARGLSALWSKPAPPQRKKLIFTDEAQTAPDKPTLDKPSDKGEPRAQPPRKRVKLGSQAAAPPKPKKAFAMIVGTGSLISVLALFAILLAWGVGMTMLLLFSDKMSARLIVQNSEMQDAYEQRLNAYRDEIARLVDEREATRVDASSLTSRVSQLLRSQGAIERRLEILAKLANQIGLGGPVGDAPAAATTGGGGAAPANPPAPPPRPGFPTRPGQTRGDVVIPLLEQRAAARMSPGGDIFGDEASGALIHRAQFAQAPTFEAPTIESGPTQSELELEQQIGRLEQAMERFEGAQTRALNGMARASNVRIGRFRVALTTLGVTPEELAPDTGRASTALANIVPLAEQNTPFGRRINEIRGNLSVLARLQPSLNALPLARPTPLDTRFSSPFGYRIHPISGVRKLHAGLDLAAPVGTPIRAAGSGVVLSAGWGGGYGNLIQIDHGNGVISRYAHLSAIEVAQGQPVAAGAIVGRMGSTGASTGSHLHFETRVKGTPANPACFLIAGDRIRDAASPGFVCDKAPFAKAAPEADEDEDDDS